MEEFADNKTMELRNIISILLCILLTSCVGSVEEGASPKSVNVKAPTKKLSFEGISHAIGVANDKIEIYFKPAIGGSEKFYYKAFVGGGENVINISSQTLSPDYQGYLRYTITGLNPGTVFKIRLDVVDQLDPNLVTETDILVEAKTFDNDVCSFSGISNITNLPGESGLDSLKITWAEPFLGGDNLLSIPGSTPEQIEISLISAKLYSPADFDNTNLNGGSGRFTFWLDYDETVTSYIARGLSKDTKYYARVRCIHRDSVVDFTKPWLRSELNNKYKQISTLSDDLSLIEYDASKVFLTKSAGVESLNTFDLSWSDISGVFDHYRVYYSKNASFNYLDTCVTNFNDAGTFCKKVSYLDETISVKTPDSGSYNVWFVICQNVNCSAGKRLEIKSFQYESLPDMAPFLGIEKIAFAEKVEELGTVKLEFTPPSIGQGYFDGFIVEHKFLVNDNHVDITADDYIGSMIVEEHDHIGISSLTVKNVPYNVQSCFAVTIYIVDDNGNKIRGQDVPLFNCSTPVVTPPSKAQFPGLLSSTIIHNEIGSGADTYNTADFILTWALPSKGIYEEFEVYVLHNNAVSFNFNQAIEQTSQGDFSNYYLYKVGPNETTTNIFGLSPVNGSNEEIIYRIGMLSHYSDYSGAHRSVANSRIYTCLIPAIPASPTIKTATGYCSTP